MIKILVEGGIEASLHSLGAEVSSLSTFFTSFYCSCVLMLMFTLFQLEFYSTLQKVSSPLKEHIPDVLASGILYIENGLFRVVPWDGKDVPEVISNSVPLLGKHQLGDYPYGIWSKGQFEYKKAGMSPHELETSNNLKVWPYVVTRRCRGKIFADL